MLMYVALNQPHRYKLKTPTFRESITGKGRVAMWAIYRQCLTADIVSTVQQINLCSFPVLAT